VPNSTRAAGRIPRWLLGGLLVGEFLLVFVHANRFFFFYDDVLWQMNSQRSPFDLRFVTQPVNDHFVPGFLTLQRVVPPLFGYRYSGIALVLALLMVLISALIWLVGKEFGVRDSRTFATAPGLLVVRSKTSLIPRAGCDSATAVPQSLTNSSRSNI
jgi:hypothetical protein